MAAKKKNTQEVIKTLAEKLLTLMGTNSKVEVSEDQENEVFIVNIDAKEETGLLIGRRGETLLSLQTVLGIMVRQTLGEGSRVVVNVGDWREKEEERLRELAISAAQRAKETGEPQPLYNLLPSQRRVVHLTLSEDSEVETESLGEGVDRYLVVKPKAR